MHTLVVATTNHGKLVELRAMLEGLAVDVVSMEEVLSPRPTIVEDGATFADNALKKARVVAAATSMLTLADDSGLEVDLLGGAPGVRSARFAHERATDAENNAALLAALDAVTRDPDGASPTTITARFRCVLALIDPFDASPEAAPIVVEGRCEGTITRTPRGSCGFGYDPLFVVEGSGRTMAELDDAEKNRVSHRARAMQALRPALAELLAARDRTIDQIARD